MISNLIINLLYPKVRKSLVYRLSMLKSDIYLITTTNLEMYYYP